MNFIASLIDAVLQNPSMYVHAGADEEATGLHR